ncbi:OLC1v1001741C1 [Oldenlandia corymbosa var. corymbosa]|uniref:OLC1v1001741C1 n=1 Tax=Oldenlandia corymbosa var. corymbosa TaxID=529605 RepID=A0AAV1D600_OLDCO|nr:OLC1v1001741C1 [Oldenlandia corymbosa var. corymbosa]
MSRANSIPKTKGSSFQTALSNPELSSFAAGGGFRQYATASVSGDKYYGAKALINLWAPSVRPNEVSSSQLWVVGGSDSDTNVILAGWHGDNYESTGCYNLQCQGFVQTSNKFALGAPFPELSNIDGLQVEFSVTIFKGQAGWFLQLNEFILGYWPFSLFSSLNNNPASSIQWGGMVFNSQIDGKESTTTQMGSGQFPDEGIRRASYMRQLQIVDENFILRGLDSPTALASQPNCYNIELANDLNWGDYILFGGPGRNPNCP